MAEAASHASSTTIRRSRAVWIASCAPAVALVVVCAIAYPMSDTVAATTVLITGFATGWIWPVLVRRPTQGDERRLVNDALNLQLTILVGLAVGALLTLVFIGMFVFAALGIAQIVWGIDAGRHLARGEDPPRRRFQRTFVR